METGTILYRKRRDERPKEVGDTNPRWSVQNYGSKVLKIYLDFIFLVVM